MKQIGQAINTLCLQPGDDETAKVQGVCQRVGFQTDQLANSIVGEQVSTSRPCLSNEQSTDCVGQCRGQCKQQLASLLRSPELAAQALPPWRLGAQRIILSRTVVDAGFVPKGDYMYSSQKK